MNRETRSDIISASVFLFCFLLYFAGCGAARKVWDNDHPKTDCAKTFPEAREVFDDAARKYAAGEITWKIRDVIQSTGGEPYRDCISRQADTRIGKFVYGALWVIFLPMRGGAELVE